LWQWPVSFSRHQTRRCWCAEGLLSSAEAEAAQRELAELSANPEAFVRDTGA